MSQPVSALGSTLYVATTGTDSGNCQDSLAPCQTISYAIGQAGTDDTVSVTGTYDVTASPLVINKAIALTSSSNAEIIGQVNITADGASIEGFSITNPDGDYGIVIPHVGNVTVSGNHISNIGNSVTTTNVYGIWYQGSTAVATSSNIKVLDNEFSNIGSATNPHSNGAILIGDSASHENITSGLEISDNTISSISSSTKGAYGIEVNLGSSADTASVTGAFIERNNISDLSGGWRTAIGLEADTPNATLTDNVIQGSSVTAVNFESNPSASTVSMSGNTLNGSSLSNSVSTVGVDDDWSSLAPGANTYPEVQGSDGSYYYYGLNAFSTIQAGVNAVAGSGTVNVAAGTYGENVLLAKAVTLNGAGLSTIIQPSTSGPGVSISANNVTVSNLKTTGAIGGGNTGSGIAITSAISSTTISNVESSGNSGHGLAINTGGALSSLSLSSVNFSNNTGDGFRIPSSMGSLDGLTITDSHFDNDAYGWEIYQPGSLDAGTVTNVSVSNSTFNNDLNKGIYAERLDHAAFNNITVTDSGTGGAAPIAVDINLKFRSFSNISFTGGSISGGQTGLAIKGRNDTPTYAAHPATVTNVTINGLSVEGTNLGIAIGNNVSGVSIQNSQITNGLLNYTDSSTIDATLNYWDSSSPDFNSITSGAITTSPYFTNAAMTIRSDAKVLPDDSGNATLDSSTPQVVVSSSTQPLTLTVSNDTSNASIDVSSLVTAGLTTSTATLPQTTINSSVANVNIPASTVVTANDPSWDGVISAPTVLTNTSVPVTTPGGYTTTLGTVIDVGSSSVDLSFSNAVRLLIPGQANQLVGFVKDGTFTQISTACNADSQATVDAQLPTDGACYINVGSDMVIWTKHFTQFVTYTQSPTPTSTSNTSSSTTSSTGSSTTPKSSSTQVASTNGGSSQVLGTATTTPNSAVSSTSTTKPAVASVATPKSGKILGLEWYLWIVALAAVAVAGYSAYYIRSATTSAKK